MAAIDDFLKSIGRTAGTMPEDFGVRTPEDPVYEGVVSTPGEAGVDSPERVVVVLFSDNTAVDAATSPYEPTNPKDPVSPQQVSQSTGAVPYEPGILHAYPDDPSLTPPAPAPAPPPAPAPAPPPA